MTRLRRSAPDGSGWSRRVHGRGFAYVDSAGDRLCDADMERCRKLVIPPAWVDVWICPFPNGHLQAVGTDDAGRRQYLYHAEWRTRRDSEKFDHVRDFAGLLPAARRRVARHLRAEEVSFERAAATAFRLFDLGVFRIGSEQYSQDNGSFGLTTLERRHVRKSSAGFTFEYVAKSGQERSLTIDDAAVLAALAPMRARRASPGDRLLAYKESGRWHDLRPESVNEYIKDVVRSEASAKDFRTWHATVLAAAVLATEDASTATARKKAIANAMREVADYLGNTPAVARSSYIDPCLLDWFDEGTTIDVASARAHMPRSGRALAPTLERAVLDLFAAHP